MLRRFRSPWYAMPLAALPVAAVAGGPLGIDHPVAYDDSGIWSRHDQRVLESGVILTELGGALWLGGEDRLGRTFWESIDASVFSAVNATALKYAFGRERPSQTNDPNQWFQDGRSFPSGEVTLQASFVTPFIAEYGAEHPAVWALELLPAYDAAARVKTHGHWQTDVLAGWGLGTLWGVYAQDRTSPFFLGLMPHGIVVGLHTAF
ncbi:MAG TPA: phosphatase PAP2 family protein [Gammaproteobacteria bacterium]|nr:phosphatase PAP2 family protein [Gammaproteobacteria bacterium]